MEKGCSGSMQTHRTSKRCVSFNLCGAFGKCLPPNHNSHFTSRWPDTTRDSPAPKSNLPGQRSRSFGGLDRGSQCQARDRTHHNSSGRLASIIRNDTLSEDSKDKFGNATSGFARDSSSDAEEFRFPDNVAQRCNPLLRNCSSCHEKFVPEPLSFSVPEDLQPTLLPLHDIFKSNTLEIQQSSVHSHHGKGVENMHVINPNLAYVRAYKRREAEEPDSERLCKNCLEYKVKRGSVVRIVATDKEQCLPRTRDVAILKVSVAPDGSPYVSPQLSRCPQVADPMDYVAPEGTAIPGARYIYGSGHLDEEMSRLKYEEFFMMLKAQETAVIATMASFVKKKADNMGHTDCSSSAGLSSLSFSGDEEDLINALREDESMQATETSDEDKVNHRSSVRRILDILKRRFR